MQSRSSIAPSSPLSPNEEVNSHSLSLEEITIKEDISSTRNSFIASPKSKESNLPANSGVRIAVVGDGNINFLIEIVEGVGKTSLIYSMLENRYYEPEVDFYSYIFYQGS